jgi:phenylalanyl-tRNA synthetase beta chain
MVQKFSYNWLCDYLVTPAPTPEVISELLTFHAFEVEEIETHKDDTVISLKILPDRGSDCLCHRGIAREIATLIDRPLAHDPLLSEVTLKTIDTIQVAIENIDDCPRFTSSIVRGVQVSESPQWLKDRLTAIGVRSINNIVDATNYVMFAMGQPLHAYDAKKFPQKEGAWNFVVRKAVVGETVSLLAEGGKDEDRIVTLSGSELLIVDGATNTAVGLAGVKGGRYAGVDATTTDIIIEAAHFDAGLTRRTARGLNIVIDASKRFENEPARALPLLAQQNIVDLIIKIAGGVCDGVIDVYPQEKYPQPVVVNPIKVNALLGLSIKADEMVSILSRGGITVETEGDTLLCTGPIARTDLNIEEDFIEEIGRVYGYHHVVSVVPETVPLTEFNQRYIFCERVRLSLVKQGFTEIITTTFRSTDEIGLMSSMASDKCFLRSELTSSVSEALTKNAPFTDLLGVSDTRLFEIGTVFTRYEGTVAEHYSLAFGIRLKTTGYSGKEDVILQTVMAQLEADLGMTLTSNVHTGVAEVNLTEVIATVSAQTSYAEAEKTPDIQYVPFSLYPSISRDVALWVSENTDVSVVEALLRKASGVLLARLTHVDTFSKEGRTSLAFRLVFQSHEKTLTASEVDEQMTAVHNACVEGGWEVR